MECIDLEQQQLQQSSSNVRDLEHFKDNADLLLSGKVLPANRQQIIAQILSHANDLYGAFEDERNYLMGEVLYSWAARQQKVSIGTLWTQQNHYCLLDTIHEQFDYFGELLEQTLSGLQYLKGRCDHSEFEIFYTKFQQLAHYFLYYSIIVSRQPPSVVIKCGDAEKHRRSRFWFNTEIRILGGRAFDLDINNNGVEIRCFLITDDTARQLLTDAYYNIYENEEFSIEPPCAVFSKIDGDLKAKFDDMRVAKKDHLRRDSVATKRYCLCYNIQLEASHGIKLIGKKVSLPFAILVGPKSDVEALLFLERSFSDLVRRPLSDMPQKVDCQEMAEALEMKFQAIAETPQKPTDEPIIVQPRMFTLQDKKHIILRLKPNKDGQIILENFLKLAVCQEYIKNKTTNEGEWKLVAFFDWFFKIAEIINKYLYQMWIDGLIYGFCGKDEAEELLRSVRQHSCLLIRFSDVEYGKIKISVRYRNNVLQHHWYDYIDLNVRSLSKELLTNHKFSEIDHIYPDINLEAALGERKKSSKNKKPRILNPTPFYFDNQCAATSSF
uniref:SH2 domain-containing protein n=1 Tax=Onchocerca volvulus TaxID=6282 RepID=A0A8R1XZG2_ONCVO